MKKYMLLIAILLAISGLQAQVTAERVVFSSMGTFSTSGSLSFSATMGETFIGTTSSSNFNFLVGFQIPSDLTVGIESSFGEHVEISVFPNPVADEMYVQLDGILNQSIHMQLFDAQGKAIPDWSIEVRQAGTFHRNVSQLASGTYFLRLSQADGQYFKTLPVIKL